MVEDHPSASPGPGYLAVHLEALSELMRSLTGAADLQLVLDLTTSALVERFGVALARIWLYDRPSDSLLLRSSAGLSSRTTDSPRYRIPLGKYPYMLSHVARSDRPVHSDDMQDNSMFEGEWVRTERIQSFAGYPLLLGDRLLGVMVLFSRERMSPDFRQSIEMLAHHVAVTLAGAQMLADEQQRSRQMTELNRISAALNSEPRLDNLLQMIADTSRTLLDADSVVVVTEAEVQGQRGFKFAAGSGLGSHHLPATLITEARELLVPILQEGRVVRLPSMQADPRFEDRHPRSIPVASMLAAPMRGRDNRVMGALLIGHHLVDMFDEQQERLAVTLAGHASIAVENARLLEDAQTAASRVRAVNHVSQALSAILDRDTLLREIQGFISGTMDAFAFAVVLWDEAEQQLQAIMRMEGGVDYGAATGPIGKGPVSQAIQSGKPCYIRHLDVDAPELVQAMSWYGDMERRTQAQLAVPMCLGEKVVGAISVQSYTPHAYSEADIEVLLGVASQAAVALENARLYEQLESSSQELSAALEELREIDRMKDLFLSSASHELKTPLTLVKGQIQLLARDLARNAGVERMSKSITLTLRNVERMTRLIESMLDISRLESGRMQLHKEPVDLAEVCRTVATSFETASGEIRILSDAPEPVVVSGDRDRLEQVLLNLVSNAISHSLQGGDIELRARAQDGKACVSVTDQGPGIPPQDLDRVFERFYQSSGSQSRTRLGGLGLGLYISRGIIEAHGGRIWVESSPGAGATFNFELPL